MTAPALAFCFCLAPWLTASQIAAPEAASRTHRYSVTGASAWVAARDQGFSALPRRCATAVDQASQSLVIGRSGSEPCRFRLFAGRPLRSGWSIEVISEQCSHPGLCRIALDGGAVPPLTGSVDANAADPDVRPLLQLFTLTLSGPPNADWRQAFRR